MSSLEVYREVYKNRLVIIRRDDSKTNYNLLVYRNKRLVFSAHIYEGYMQNVEIDYVEGFEIYLDKLFNALEEKI